MSRGEWDKEAYRVLATLVAVIGSACVSVKSTTTYSETRVSSRSSVKVQPGSRVVDASANVRGETLIVSVATEHTCRMSTIDVYMKTEHVKREIDRDASNTYKFHPAYPIATGSVFLGIGALVFANADSIAAQPNSSGQVAKPDDVRSEGLAVGAIGLPFIAIGVIDALRLRDSDTDVGEVEHESDVTTGACRRRPVSNKELVLVADSSDWRVTSTSNDRGVVRFLLTEMPEAAFRHQPDDDVDDGLSFTLHADEESVPLTVDGDDARQLREALSDDPNSRVAVDRVAAKAAADAKLAAAKAAADAKLAETKQALAECQAFVDNPSSGVVRAADCWKSHSEHWSALNVTDDVPACLASVSEGHQKVAACTSANDRSDDDAIHKLDCLKAIAIRTDGCGPLNVENRRAADRAALIAALAKLQPRVDKIVARRAEAATAEAERQAKKEAAEKKESERCGGTNVWAIAFAIQVGRDVDPAAVRGCRYAVGFGIVQNSTSDGWTIVSSGGGGSSAVIALGSRKLHADGSMVRAGTAAYLGLRSFNRVGGGTATIPTFSWSE